MWQPQTNSVPGSVETIRRHIAVRKEQSLSKSSKSDFVAQIKYLIHKQVDLFSIHLLQVHNISTKLFQLQNNPFSHLSTAILLLLFLAFLEYYTCLRTGPIFHSPQLALCPNVLENCLPFTFCFCFCFKSLITRIWQLTKPN